MLINKLRKSEDFKSLQGISAEYFDELSDKTPEYLLELISKIIAVFLYRLNVPRKEVEQFTDQIKGGEFQMLFDSFEAYEVQETRRISRAEGARELILEFLGELGMVSDKLKSRIIAEQDLEVLKTWAKLAAKAESLEQFCVQANLQT